VHAGVHGGIHLNYWILQRFDPEVRFCGGIDAGTGAGLGDIPLGTAALWDFATRKAAAMMASRTVLMGSSSDTTDTIPASQARASNCGSLRVISTTRSGLDKGSGSRANADSSKTRTLSSPGSGRSTDSTRQAQLREGLPHGSRVDVVSDRKLNRLHHRRLPAPAFRNYFFSW